MQLKTIAAIATPEGHGGIGIVKISGPQSISIARQIFTPSILNSKTRMEEKLLENPKAQARGFFHGFIANPERGQVLDEVLMLVMPGPHSYTREDVVEIHCHGGPILTRTILALVLTQGAVLAEPGEFTKIAFLNGRIDLTQAEAVMDLINAGTENGLEIAAKQLSGELKTRIETILATLTDIAAEGEAAIDFPEEVEGLFQKEKIIPLILNDVVSPVEILIQRYHQARALGKGLKVIIVGKPNVGKSSLMNCLLEKDRVIVSDVPGTTRDFIEEGMMIKGMSFILADTAGLHETQNRIEQIGLEKTREQIEEADLILFVLDLQTGIETEDKLIHEEIKDKKFLMVFNKMDLLEANSLIKQDNMSVDLKNSPGVRVSAKYSINTEALKKVIFDALSEFQTPLFPEDYVFPNFRHFQCLSQCLESSHGALNAINDGLPVEFCVMDIKNAMGSLEDVLGISAKQDLLDSIFSRFCIGK
ncbi:MAG: tRNA uridine-5-carboxymethylaminomethyl(34) synthesis GTPase MnmE [Proteobacteria bacterium]|nr:tRNA uridine-5-carboxymethylaminomethyl(34) synthesis GTPase MnmE [Pseudomonadota bacterium]